MAGQYVKLFGSILNSTVWCADTETKLIWITMLLLADSEGVVWGAVPGIARQAGVSLQAARRALEYLTSEDPDSRTKAEGGRRLLVIDGGWKIINAQKYREMQTDGQRRASERAQRYRLRKRSVTERDVRDASRLSCIEEEVEVEEEEETKGKTDSSLRSDVAVTAVVQDLSFLLPKAWSAEACDDWITRFDGTAPGGPIGKHLKPLVTRHGWPAVRMAWRSYLAQTEAAFASPARFGATYGEWAGTKRGAVSQATLNRMAMVQGGLEGFRRDEEAARDTRQLGEGNERSGEGVPGGQGGGSGGTEGQE